MEIEIDLHTEGPDGFPHRIGTAVFKDVDPAWFGAFGDPDVFAASEHWIGIYVWNGWPAAGRLVISGRLRPAGADVEITTVEEDDPDERADVLRQRRELAAAAGDDSEPTT